jgi:hypothetical protein
MVSVRSMFGAVPSWVFAAASVLVTEQPEVTSAAPNVVAAASRGIKPFKVMSRPKRSLL